MERKKARRKISNYWIMPGYQGRFLLLFVSVGSILVGFEAAFFYFSSKTLIETLISQTGMVDAARLAVETSFRSYSTFVVLDSLALVLVFTLLGLFFSHRIAGPVYRIKKTIEQIRGGDTQARIHLRNGDELRELAEDFNKMMDTLTDQKQPRPSS